jgi:hypothetical protein
MNWVLGYFAVGLGLLALGRVAVALYYRFKRSRFVDDVMAAAGDDNVVSPASRRAFWQSFGLGAVIVALWPAAVVALIVRPRASSHHAPLEPELRCKIGDLVEAMRPADVEAAEKVEDPLARVPDLPFGHLHTAWIRFKAQLRAGDVVWRFKTAGWGTPRSAHPYGKHRGLAQGYAIVRRRKVVAEFIVQWDHET